VAVPCLAQQTEPGLWQLKGSAGFSAFTSNFVPVAGSPIAGQNSSYSAVAGDLRLGLSGFLKDPKFVLFDLGFAGQLASNGVDKGFYNSDLWGLTGDAILLPRSTYPLRVFYSNNLYDTSGNVLTSTSSSSLFGADWTLRSPRFPRVDVSFTQQTENIRFPTSLTDTGFRQNLGHVSADDIWKNWHWTGGFDLNDTLSRSAGVFVLNTPLTTNSKVPSFSASRSFWADKGYFNFYASGNFQQNLLGQQNVGNSRLIYATPSLRIQHTSKLSSQYAYAFTQSQISGLATALLPGAGTIFFSTPRLDTHSLSGRVDYQVRKAVRLFQEVRYTHTTPFVTTVETIKSLTDSVSGIEYQRAWRTVSLSGMYAGDLQFVGTNLNNSAHTFSNNVQGRASWGDLQRLRLTGSFVDSKQNYVAQLGAFAANRQAAVEMETNRLRIFRLYARAERNHVQVLNPSGNTKQDFNGYQVQLSARRISAGYSQGLVEGVGALFPASVTQNPFITVPLPLELLTPTPLLDRTGRLKSAFLTAHLLRNFDVSADWRREKDILATSNQSYRLFEVHALYRVGKITAEGVVGSYLTEVLATESTSGLRLNRCYLRVARDFKIF